MHVRDLVLPDNAPPRGVAASLSHIAVSSWLESYSGDHVVCLLDAATGEPIRVFGDVTPEPTVAAPGRLVRPAGVRFSADGTQVRGGCLFKGNTSNSTEPRKRSREARAPMDGCVHQVPSISLQPLNCVNPGRNAS